MVGGNMGSGMETSLRYNSHSKTLRIHAKEKLPLDSKTLIQAHGEIEIGARSPSFLALSIRRFYPELSASTGVGLQFNNQDKFGYNIRGKKALSLAFNGMLGINLKGRCDTDKDFKQRKAKGAVELAWSILDFQKGQDVRVKVGYDLLEMVPYFQIRENNWTLNANTSGRWNVIPCSFNTSPNRQGTLNSHQTSEVPPLRSHLHPRGSRELHCTTFATLKESYCASNPPCCLGFVKPSSPS